MRDHGPPPTRSSAPPPPALRAPTSAHKPSSQRRRRGTSGLSECDSGIRACQCPPLPARSTQAGHRLHTRWMPEIRAPAPLAVRVPCFRADPPRCLQSHADVYTVPMRPTSGSRPRLTRCSPALSPFPLARLPLDASAITQSVLGSWALGDCGRGYCSDCPDQLFIWNFNAFSWNFNVFHGSSPASIGFNCPTRMNVFYGQRKLGEERHIETDQRRAQPSSSSSPPPPPPALLWTSHRRASGSRRC